MILVIPTYSPNICKFGMSYLHDGVGSISVEALDGPAVTIILMLNTSVHSLKTYAATKKTSRHATNYSCLKL